MWRKSRVAPGVQVSEQVGTLVYPFLLYDPKKALRFPVSQVTDLKHTSVTPETRACAGEHWGGACEGIVSTRKEE